MPQYELRDPFGTSYRLTTTSHQLAEQWFSEWLPRLFPPGGDPRYGPPMVQIYPLVGSDGKTPDWPADTRAGSFDHFAVPADPAQVMQAIADRRSQIEVKIGMRNEHGSDGG